MMARRGLAVLLSFLLAIPAAASPSKTSTAVAIPIGTFSHSDSTNVSGAGALAGTTVFSGDMIEVGPRGAAGILLNSGMQVRVSSASRLRLKELGSSAKHVELEIFSGAARFRTSETSLVVARLADATVRAKGAKPAVGIISILSPNKAMIGAELGELLVSTAHDGRSITLREGEAVELTLTDPPAQSSNEKRTRSGTLTGKQVAVIGILAALAVLLIGVTALSTGLTDQQKQDLVSPFKFP